jgi:chromosome segregation ATPase
MSDSDEDEIYNLSGFEQPFVALGSAATDVETVQKEMEELREAHRALEDQYASLQKQHTALQVDHKTAEQQLNSTEQQLQAVTQDRDKLAVKKARQAFGVANLRQLARSWPLSDRDVTSMVFPPQPTENGSPQLDTAPWYTQLHERLCEGLESREHMGRINSVTRAGCAELGIDTNISAVDVITALTARVQEQAAELMHVKKGKRTHTPEMESITRLQLA